MRFYGLIDEFKNDQPHGIYSIIKTKKNFDYSKNISDTLNRNKKLLWLTPIASIGVATFIGFEIYKSITESNDFELKVTSLGSNDDTKKIVFTKDTVKGNYGIINSAPDLFYGLFDDFFLKEISFKKILESKGGSELIIIEKKSLPENSHYGGIHGKFTTGLYCEHPKDPQKLVPLSNFSELIKSSILEEAINSFQLLGAKSILIEDIKKTEGIIGGDIPLKGKGNISAKHERETLRKKEYNKGSFQPALCLKRLEFLPDYPSLMNVIDGRINGNQTLEEFAETIDLSANIDLKVLNLFESQAGFNFKRKWSFKVEFFDKNELHIG